MRKLRDKTKIDQSNLLFRTDQYVAEKGIEFEIQNKVWN